MAGGALAFALVLSPPCDACRPLPSSSPSLPPAPRRMFSSAPSSSLLLFGCRLSSSSIPSPPLPSRHPFLSNPMAPPSSSRPARHLVKAAEYVFPDPIPEFAEAETEKFKMHLLERLSRRKDIFGDAAKEVVGICTEILRNFLHTEYGGPGTLLVVPFIDMADTLNENGLPGGPQAARAAVVWAQKHIDKDWNEWTGGDDSE